MAVGSFECFCQNSGVHVESSGKITTKTNQEAILAQFVKNSPKASLFATYHIKITVSGFG